MNIDIHKEQALTWLADLDSAVSKMSIVGKLLYVVDMPSTPVLREAVRVRPACIMYLKEQPAEDIALLAVEIDGATISHIKNPSTAVCLAALKNRRNAIEYIEKPSTEMQILALTHGLEPGYFDSVNLAYWLDKFEEETLNIINPAIAMARSLYSDDDCDCEEMISLYDAIQPLRVVAADITMPSIISS